MLPRRRGRGWVRAEVRRTTIAREAGGPEAGRDAKPLRCDATWVGSRRGDWSRPSNWSTGRVPDRSTQACTPRRTTVVVSHGRNFVWAVESGGSLALTGGSLLLMGTTVASEVADLRLVNATIGGPGRLIVTRHLSWGPAGKMLGAGEMLLGLGSRSEIATGVGRRAGDIGGPDGTGPHAVNGRGAPAPACGPYSPPWAQACATRHPRADAAIRRAWARFARVANDTGRDRSVRVDEIVPLLAPHTCGLTSEAKHHNTPSPRGDCHHVARGVLDEVATSGPLSVVLGTRHVQGDQAAARAKHVVGVRFRRVNGVWLITEL